MMSKTISLDTRRLLPVYGVDYHYQSLPVAFAAGLGDGERLPFSLKVLLENLLRHEDSHTVTLEDMQALVASVHQSVEKEVAFRPARVLMQDFTGVPAIVDLAAMRDAVIRLGGKPEQINPLIPVDLVIDHSVQVDANARSSALLENIHFEMGRNLERYSFLRWGQQAFSNFRVVPPGTGICHQVNLEYLAKTVWSESKDGFLWAYPDTVVGTDSHTTMINALGVLGWGVGGIEAEAAMLGQPITMLIPQVVGFKLTSALKPGVTATDLVLTITQMLRQKGVVGRFVEFYGEGLDHLPLANRATIANMAPEYGATCGFFPVDAQTIEYLKLSGRSEADVARVEAYCKIQGLWRGPGMPDPIFSDTVVLDLSEVHPSVAGPKRPQDRVLLSEISTVVEHSLKEGGRSVMPLSHPLSSEQALSDGAVVIAAITSCTNTSNPSVMLGAGLLARRAVQRGLRVKPWVKTSLAPGSKVVSDYLRLTGLQDDLDQLGFQIVGYGCTTCIGNSGPLPEWVQEAIEHQDLCVCAVLSGNRNFEGRIHPLTKDNWLASPPLVVAFALAGTTRISFESDPIGLDSTGAPVFLRDLWPTDAEIAHEMERVTGDLFQRRYADVFSGDEEWQEISAPSGQTYVWQEHSTYVKNPPYFDGLSMKLDSLSDIHSARILALLGDSVTTDHISPAGFIKKDSPAGRYLMEHGVEPVDFNSYGSRRGHDEVMVRGTFANTRIRNEMLSDIEGGMTRHWPSAEVLSIFDAAVRYQSTHTPLVVIAGAEYGTGSSRDWAAKGTRLLGIKAVVAESFERIHRSNLVGFGILPLQFIEGDTRRTLALDGSESLDILGLSNVVPGGLLKLKITRTDGSQTQVDVLCRIDTRIELDYYRHGGILPYVLRQLVEEK